MAIIINPFHLLSSLLPAVTKETPLYISIIINIIIFFFPDIKAITQSSNINL